MKLESIFVITMLFFLNSCSQNNNNKQEMQISVNREYFLKKETKNILSFLRVYCKHAENGKKIQIGKGFENYYTHKPDRFDVELFFDNSYRNLNGDIQIEIHELQMISECNTSNLKYTEIGGNLNEDFSCIGHRYFWVGKKILYSYSLEKKQINNKITIKNINYQSVDYSSSIFYQRRGFRIIASFQTNNGKNKEYLVEEFIYTI